MSLLRFVPASSQLSRWFPQPYCLVLGVCGSLGLWLGMANQFVHLPVLVLMYPAALALLGQTAPDYATAMRRGWLTGLVGSAAALSWIAVPVHNVGGLPWIAALACSTIIGGYLGLYAGASSVIARYARHFPLWRQALAFGLGWWVLEGLRNWLFSGFPWLPLASAFVIWPAWIQGASVIGAYGLSGVFAGLAGFAGLAALNACPLNNSLHGWQGTSPAKNIRHAAVALAIAVLGCCLLVYAGLWRLNTQGTAPESGPELAVALVQGNIDQNQKWDTAYQQATIQRYINLSAPTVANSLIIWPETSVPLAYGVHALSSTLRDWSMEQRVWLLFGSLGMRRKLGDYDIFNRAYLLDPNGQDQGLYEKEHLVPFGEYMPSWLNIPFLLPLLQNLGDFTPGVTTAPLTLAPVQGTSGGQSLALGVLICYETIFPELARQRVAEGATLLINISNDAWFGRSAAPEQHLQLSALRAVEQQRWMARGTNTGISALIDPFGRIKARSNLFEAETLRGSVYAGSGLTPFFHLFPYLLPLATVLLALCLFVRPRRHRD